MTRPAMTGEVTSPVLPGDWVDPAACPPGRRATGLVTRFGSLPFRQLAGPAGVFFLWPPKSRARTSTSPGAQP